MNNKNTNIMLEEIRLKIDQDYEGDIGRVAKEFLTKDPYLVNDYDGILHPEKVAGWIVIELPPENSEDRNPKPKIHTFEEDKEDDAKKLAKELYGECGEDWLEVICRKEEIVRWDLNVGTRTTSKREKATENNLLEIGVAQIINRIKVLLTEVIANHEKGIMPYRRYDSLENIQSKWLQPVRDYQTRYAAYVMENHIDDGSELRMMTVDEHRRSQNHSGKLSPPRLPDVKLRKNANPDFVEALHTFLFPLDTPSISEVTALSHYRIASFFGVNRKFRPSLVSNRNTTRAFTNSNFKDTVAKMTQFGFTMQAILDPKTNRCVGSLNLDQMVHLLAKKGTPLPETLELDELRALGILGPIPPTLDGNAPVTQAEALFSSGCKAILFESASTEESSGELSNAATLEEGLHIMTAHDLVAYATLLDD